MLQVAVRLDAIGLGRFDQTVQIRRGVGAAHTVAEQVILAAHDEWPYRVLDKVIVDSQITVVQIHDQRFSLYPDSALLALDGHAARKGKQNS